MELVSVGDHVVEGEYILHSRFSKAVNFVKVKQGHESSQEFPLLTCVDNDIGAGPTNIVFHSFQNVRGTFCSIAHNCFMFAQQEYVFDASIRYQSSPQIVGVTCSQYLDRLKFLETELVRHGSPKSLIFLLQSDVQPQAHSGFEQAVRQRCRDSVKELLSGNFRIGVDLIKGVGFGLTPGGDDFLTGLLLGLWLMQQIGNYDYAPLRKCIYNAALGENLLSNTFLHCAKEGWLFERWQHVVKFLTDDNAVLKHAIVRELLMFGETSGADTMTGLVFALRNAETMIRKT